jgi:oxygen-independent coproporphyrinogen-3 oxidase
MLRDTIDLSSVVEWSVESNPGTLGPATLDALRAMGADRLSVGVQSFEDVLLRSVGRIHTGAQAEEAVRSAVASGFPRVSVDLLFAVPGQGEETFHRDLDRALDLGTTHLSCYALLYEEGTSLTRRESRGLVQREDEDAEVRMLRHARARLRAAGFRAYEISNFALPGHECLHNLVYWRNEPYLGVGVAATSFLGGVRSTAVRDLRAYIDRITTSGDATVERESLEPAAALGETIMLGLRMDEGLSLSALSLRHDPGAVAALVPVLRSFAARGLVHFDDDVFRITEDAIPLTDEIVLALMPEEIPHGRP